MRRKQSSNSLMTEEGILLSSSMESMRNEKLWAKMNKDAKRMGNKIAKMFDVPGPRRTQLSPAMRNLIIAFAELMAELKHNYEAPEERKPSHTRPSFRTPANIKALKAKSLPPKEN